MHVYYGVQTNVYVIGHKSWWKLLFMNSIINDKKNTIYIGNNISFYCLLFIVTIAKYILSNSSTPFLKYYFYQL